MNEEEIEDFLLSSLDKRKYMEYTCNTETFEDAGIITEERGIVLSIDDGSVFHLTIEMYSEANDT